MNQKPSIGRIVHYAGSSSGKFRPAIIVEVYGQTDLCLLAVVEPFATPVGMYTVEAREISADDAARGALGWFWPPIVPVAEPLTETQVTENEETPPEGVEDLTTEPSGE